MIPLRCHKCGYILNLLSYVAGQDPKQGQSYEKFEKSKYHPSHESFFRLVSNEELSNKINYEQLKIHI